MTSEPSVGASSVMATPFIEPDLILAQWRRERPDLKVAPMGLMDRLLRTAHLADATFADGLGLLRKLLADLETN